MRIDKNESVGHFAARNPQAVRLFEAWGVDYCCNGHRSVSELCASIGITLAELATQVDTTAQLARVPERNWLQAPLPELISFLVDYFHRQTRSELDRIEALAGKVYEAHHLRNPELAHVVALAIELSKTMRPHMLKEEQVLFPFIRDLSEAVAAGRLPATPFFGSVQNPIRMMVREHEGVAEIFERLRAATDDCELPDDACGSFSQLYASLQELEEMTHQHIHLENNILFTRAEEIEESSVRPALTLAATKA